MAARRRDPRRQLLRIRSGLESAVEAASGRVALRAWQALTSATPVDTGFARAGWAPSTGSPDPGPELPDKTGGGAEQRFRANEQRARAIAQSFRLAQGRIFIVNPVRYIRRLNEGWSAQAPAMFIERAVAAAVAASGGDQ